MSETGQPGCFGLSQRARRTTSAPIGYLITKAMQTPGLISLAAGLVDYESLPGEATAALAAELLGDVARARPALQYGTTEGDPVLRGILLDHLAGLDGVVPQTLGGVEDLLVTTGSQQLLYLLTDVLVDPGDIVLTGWPSYFVYTGTLAAAGADVRGVDMDADGILPEALEDVLETLARQGQLPRVKILYLVSYHQNPTGITLAGDRKPRILEIVRRFSRDHRILIIEDAAYRELTYQGEVPRSCRALPGGRDHVALLQTFSKPFAPGLKTGYGLLPRDLVAPVLLQKNNMDFGSANLMQHLLVAAMRDGTYARHLARLRETYARKCRAMLDALQEHLGDFRPADVHWTHPRGGLYVFLTLPAHIDTRDTGPLFARCLEEGVLYVPGDLCFGPDPTRDAPRSTMRLSFGVATEADLREGVARLARAIRAVDV